MLQAGGDSAYKIPKWLPSGIILVVPGMWRFLLHLSNAFSEKKHIRHVAANVPGISRRAKRPSLLTGFITDTIRRWTHPLVQTILVCRGTVHGLISDVYRQIVAAFVVPASSRKRQESVTSVGSVTYFRIQKTREILPLLQQVRPRHRDGSCLNNLLVHDCVTVVAVTCKLTDALMWACVEPLFSRSRFLLWLNLCFEVGFVNQLETVKKKHPNLCPFFGPKNERTKRAPIMGAHLVP